MPAPGEQHRATSATINPFEEIIPRISEFTAQEIATLQSRLDRQLGPEYISTRPGAGGGKVHYLAAEKVINLANGVFGFNGWSSSIQNVQVDFVDEGQGGKISLGLSITCRVTLRDGTYHEDIGYGQIENCKSKAAAFEKAKKEAATDALKRSLRNFGNVLGNCLYDKDYLAKISKIKVAPSKWSVDNLHRHPDYAPITAESLDDTAASKKPARTESANSAISTGTEYEDEFGGNLFDEMTIDRARPDEVVLDGSTVMETPYNGPASRLGDDPAQQIPPRPPPRVQSLPALRQTNGQQAAQQAAQQNGQQSAQQVPQSRPQFARQQPQASHPAILPHNDALRNRMPPPQLNANQPPRQPPPQQQHQPPSAHPSTAANTLDSQGTRSNPSSAPDPAALPQPHTGPQEPQQHATPPSDAAPAHRPPVGFITSRSADLVRDRTPNDPPLNIPLPAFNPHADSPSIRRTSGVNHNTSAPVSRQAHQAINPAGAVGVPNGPPIRTNFVNPQADLNRRIGMPGGGVPSPLANRSAYKPPGPMKRPVDAGGGAVRPPLADVSNVQLDGGGDGAGDFKRARVEST